MKFVLVLLVILFSQALLAAASILDLLDHHKVPQGVRIPPVLMDSVGDDPYNSQCEVRAIRVYFYSPADREVIDVDFGLLIPKTKKKSPAITILPNTYGVTMIEGDLAGALCRNGFAVAYPDGKRGFAENIQDIDQLNRAEILLQRTLIDYLQTVTEIASEKIGVMGVSYGAIVATMLVASDTRIKGAVLVGAGTPISQILASTDNEVVTEFRVTEMKRLKLNTPAEFEKAANSAIKIDPLVSEFNLAKLKNRTLQVIILGDKTVQTQTQIDLWQAMGKPVKIEINPTIRLGSGHVAGILKWVNSELGTTLEFLKRTLK